MNGGSRIVTFDRLSRAAEARPDETLLDVARRVAAPLGNSCGGTGICARCRVHIVSGGGNLSVPTAIELRVAQQRNLGADERLACQAVVMGDCAITTPYW